MNKTGKFWSIPQMIYIPLLAIASAFDHLQLGFDKAVSTLICLLWQSRLASALVEFFMRRFYNTFISISEIFYAFQYINSLFKGNIFTIKTLYICLLTPSIWYTFQKDFIKLCITNFITCLCSREGSQIFINLNNTGIIASQILIHASSSFHSSSRAFDLTTY